MNLKASNRNTSQPVCLVLVYCIWFSSRKSMDLMCMYLLWKRCGYVSGLDKKDKEIKVTDQKQIYSLSLALKKLNLVRSNAQIWGKSISKEQCGSEANISLWYSTNLRQYISVVRHRSETPSLWHHPNLKANVSDLVEISSLWHISVWMWILRHSCKTSLRPTFWNISLRS